jgi:catechol 2,3-dioxygenase-like lactoylglutathione lyase family enzyme
MYNDSVSSGAVLYVKDLARSVAFFQAVAGLREDSRGDDYVVLVCNAFELVILRTPATAAIELTDPPIPRTEAAVKLVFFVSDLAAARAAMLACGGVPDPVEKQWVFRGYTVSDGIDPEGNKIQLRAPGE